MKSPKIITFRMDGETVEKLDSYAAQDERDRSFLLNEAIGRYLEARDFQVARVEEGIRQADAGDLLDHDVVMSRLKKRRSRR
jgi:predicted transcriptional regulator